MPTMVEIAPQVIPILDLAGQYRGLCGEALPDLADSLRRGARNLYPRRQPTGAAVPIS
jgi:hypothetical protein